MMTSSIAKTSNKKIFFHENNPEKGFNGLEAMAVGVFKLLLVDGVLQG